MIYAFYILAALLIWLSYRSFRGGIDYLNYFKKEMAKPPSAWTPFATIIAPCKGIDEGLRENLLALIGQDHPSYEVIFVVDSGDDPAVPLIEDISREVSETPKTKLVIAAKAEVSSQKVENLREGVLHADTKSEVLVFVDSDARPSADWLSTLIAPLENGSVGAATGYRWFISEPQTFGGELRSAWNASIASALGPNEENNFCWGGSMAIRRRTFDRLDMRKRWLGTLSDDFTITRAIKQAGLVIKFVPQALTPTFESGSLKETLEFTNRQMKITRVYAPNLWKLSFFGSGLFSVVMISAMTVIFVYPTSYFAFWAGLFTLLLVTGFSIGKAWYRLKAVELALGGHSDRIRKQTLGQITLWALTPPLFFINCFVALLSRKLKWRGIRYLMISHEKTLRL